jgi:predicted HTH transcriptional regulator
MEKQEYKGVSKRARALLNGQENYDVDFKRAVSGLESDDMVAFANSRHGGAILIGVDEMKIADGRQRGKIVGCPVGDKEKLSIISRAESCIPPVEVQIIVENAGSCLFIGWRFPAAPRNLTALPRDVQDPRGWHQSATDPTAPADAVCGEREP